MEFSTISFFPHLRLLNGVKFIVPDMYRGDLAVHRLLMDCLITEQCESNIRNGSGILIFLIGTNL